MLDPAKSRVTLVTALAWRAIVEIVRRRHATHAFKLRQVHPGISIRGLLELQLHCTSTGRALPAIDFNLGGPSGTWSTGSGAQGSFLALLEPEPGSVIDRIEAATGLPPFRGMLPASSTEGLSVRVVAGLAEGRVFDRQGWRTTLGAYGAHNGDAAADWAVPMGVEFDAPGPGRDLTPDAHDRLSRLVLIHRAADECPVANLSDLEGRGLLVDIATGRIASAERDGVNVIGNLRRMHSAVGGSMERLLAQLAAEF
ncbi:hypothetical protein WCE37_01430 [Luteimonas sp. MJ250]|uniref:TY-Chap2 family putative peptide chaperone n=1 Tax=Luteimonas sp. MJ250 TaxID=3129236 RepID=UPI0031BA1836